ncbi:TetR/AcrR family transcriptional regulator C-terminal ligand-binding domain-containing protein [Microbacterium sp. cx-55]|nr:TetR/AcrR family transcriptional regulator C-terminal ligand-binding domain-containing protein [Microbacterium sp. cx-55]
MQTDTELARQYREVLLQPQMAAVAQRLERGGAVDPDAAAELLLGPVLHRWLLRSRAFDHDWIEQHVDRTLRGAEVD